MMRTDRVSNAWWVTAALMGLVSAGVWAENVKTETVKAIYPNLATGVLLYARPADLPDGVLLNAEGIQITREQVETVIAQQSSHIRTLLEKEMFYVLEQETAGMLLARAARDALDDQEHDLDEMSDEQLINTFLEQLTTDIAATEQEQRAFYEENPHFFHGAPFHRTQPQIEHYLSAQKKQQFVDDYVKNLGQTLSITVCEAWTQQQAKQAKDNPLDKARQSGIPTVALFYAASPCCPDHTASILSAMAQDYGSRLNVVTLNPNTEPILTARYGIEGNPALRFYDADGNEIYGHQGSMSRQEITARLAEMGIH